MKLFFYALTLAASSAFAQNECDDAYYGIEQSVNHSKAFTCYKKFSGTDSYSAAMAAILTHNGQGTKADHKAALKLAKKLPAEEAESKALVTAIEAKKSDLDYCTDVAQKTPALKRCADLEIRRSKESLERWAKINKKKLSQTNAKLHDKLEDAKERLQEAEGELNDKYKETTKKLDAEGEKLADKTRTAIKNFRAALNKFADELGKTAE